MYKRIVISKNINLCIIFLLFFLFLKPPLQIYAQTLPTQDLRITPIIQDLTFSPGEKYSYPFIIENLADKPMGIHIDINGFDPTQEVTQNGIISQGSPLTSWTKIAKTDVIISPHSQETVPVSITIPPTIKQGGYYETFIVTPFISQKNNIHQPVILTRFIAVVFVTIGNVNYNDLEKKVTIEKFNAQSFLLSSPNTSLNLQVKNNYFTHFIAKPYITLSPLFGKQEVIQPEEKHIFPGSLRTWEIPLSHLDSALFYTATVSVYVGNGNKVLAQTHFFVLPQKLIITVLIVCLLITLTLLRKRIWKFVYTLFKG